MEDVFSFMSVLKLEPGDGKFPSFATIEKNPCSQKHSSCSLNQAFDLFDVEEADDNIKWFDGDI